MVLIYWFREVGLDDLASDGHRVVMLQMKSSRRSAQDVGGDVEPTALSLVCLSPNIHRAREFLLLPPRLLHFSRNGLSSHRGGIYRSVKCSSAGEFQSGRFRILFGWRVVTNPRCKLGWPTSPCVQEPKSGKAGKPSATGSRGSACPQSGAPCFDLRWRQAQYSHIIRGEETQWLTRCWSR